MADLLDELGELLKGRLRQNRTVRGLASLPEHATKLRDGVVAAAMADLPPAIVAAVSRLPAHLGDDVVRAMVAELVEEGLRQRREASSLPG